MSKTCVVENPTVAFQLNELTTKLDSLASFVHGFASGGQRPNHETTKRPNPPTSPGQSSSSSSKSNKSNESPDQGGSPGGGGGSPPSSRGLQGSPIPSSEGRHCSNDPYAIEKRLMRIKNYDTMKLPSLPKNAAEVRVFRNSVFNTVCKMSKGDEAPVFAWVQECANPKADLSNSAPYPILDRVLGCKLLELSKSTRFAMHFQSIQEEAQKFGRQPKGRKLLWVILEKYKMEKDKGVALTQSHLLNLKLLGNDVKALEEFRSKFDYIWQALEPSDRPAETAVRSHLFEQLKHHPKLQLAIDKFRNASSSSSKRTSKWLYEKMIETIEICQLEENSANIEKSLANIGKVDANANPAKPEKGKRDKEGKADKQTKESKPSKASKPDKPNKEQPKEPITDKSKASKAEVPAAGAKGKGKGKDEKGQKGGKGQETEKRKQPCMYYGYDSCTKGKDCPYLHDPSNKYKGPKPKGLKAKESSSSAGAATVVAATCLASQTKVASGNVVSSLDAPQRIWGDEGLEPNNAEDCAEERIFRGAINEARQVCKDFLKATPSKVRSRPSLPKVSLFEKAIKIFSAVAACVNPVLPHVNQEFLLDTGAGRNLISYRSMPDEFKEHVFNAPEKVQFATGGGIRPSSKALKLEGSLSGTNTFYALKDCPHALSVGIQVNEHQRPFVWFPNQLPYLIKADRVQDIVHHVPESAKIYADRVHENVPIMSESVCIAMPASTGGSSSSRGPDRLPEAVPSPAPAPVEEPLTTSEMTRPPDLPRSEKSLELKKEVLPRFGFEDDELKFSEPVAREVGDAALDSEDEESNPWNVTLREKLQEEARSPKHALTHFPKNRYCEICQRAKMTSRYHRKKGLEVDPEKIPPLHFGHLIRADHIVLGSDLTKGSEGEEACLICLDEFNGVLQAFPQTNRTTDANISALQRFGGTKAHKKALCSVKTDCVPELVEAVKFLGWLPDPGIPNDDFHNAKLERTIRLIKEGVRSIHLKAGFPHELWPRSVEYFCVAHNFTTPAPIHPNESDEAKFEKSMLTCFEAANRGAPFEGSRIPLGALVYYKPPKHRELPAFSPRTFPGIFCGWRLDSGYAHRKVHLVLDYENLRSRAKGFGRPIQVYASELVEPTAGNFIFPLHEAKVAQLNLFQPTVTLPFLAEREALPFEGIAPTVVPRKRRTYVTLERGIKFGKTVGCKGCAHIAEGVPHSDACHERFRSLLEADRVAKEAKAREVAASETPAPDKPAMSMPSAHAATVSQGPLDAETFFASCHESPGKQEAKGGLQGPQGDFWEFDESRSAWKMIHVRPRKRLYAPVGKDCPFNADAISSERVTEWKCKGVVSVYRDNWQLHPHQRISSKSWVGATWFFPTKAVDLNYARIKACQANIVR